MLTVRRIGIPSYYLTAALATLALTLLSFALTDLVNLRRYQSVVIVSESRNVTSVIGTPAIFEHARSLLMIFLTALLWGWLLNLALRLTRGVQFNMRANKGTLELTSLSPARASLTVALVSMPLKAVSVLLDALEPAYSGFGASLPFGVQAGHIEFEELAYGVLLSAITSFIFAWLAVLLFNRFAVRSGGPGLQISRGVPGTRTVTAARVAHIQLTTALFAGCLFGLAMLLFRLVSDEVFLLIRDINQFGHVQPHGLSEAWATLPLKRTLTLRLPSQQFIALNLLLGVPAYWFLNWPLWALIYNWLARRNGGLELEVEGDVPAPVEAA